MDKLSVSEEYGLEIVCQSWLEGDLNCRGIVYVYAGKNNDVTVFDFCFSKLEFSRSEDHCVKAVGCCTVEFTFRSLIPICCNNEIKGRVSLYLKILKCAKVSDRIIEQEIFALENFNVGIRGLNAEIE